MARKSSVRIEGLGDRLLEQKLAQAGVRIAAPQPLIFSHPQASIMNPPAVIPQLRRMDHPEKYGPIDPESGRPGLIETAIRRQAETGAMAGVPLRLANYNPDHPYYMPKPREQGFYYDWNSDRFGIAPLLESRMVNDAGYNRFEIPAASRFAEPNAGAYAHTHPAWAEPQPGPADDRGKVPMFVIHKDRVTHIPAKGDRQPVRSLPGRYG